MLLKKELHPQNTKLVFLPFEYSCVTPADAEMAPADPNHDRSCDPGSCLQASHFLALCASLSCRHTLRAGLPRLTTAIYEAAIARCLLTALCLVFSRPSSFFATASSAFATVSPPSVRIISMWHGLLMYGLMRPCARYVRRRCLGAWLTWMCLTTRLEVSRPLISAFASAFLRRPRRNSADLTGWRALETPNCLPGGEG